MSIAIIIPAYKESDNIEKARNILLQTKELVKESYEQIE